MRVPFDSSPVVVIGMHRSGTSLVVRVLERLGWFGGRYQESNNEAWLQHLINVALFRKAGGRWDYPYPVKHFVGRQDLVKRFGESIEGLMRSPVFAVFTGPLAWLRFRHPDNLAIPWGWKDPRNTYTLPVWRFVFPELRVVHVKRHGIDVARSLHVRSSARSAEPARVRSLGGLLLARSTRVTSADTIEGGVKLWLEYLRQADSQMAVMAPSKSITVSYEELLLNPNKEVSRLARFVEVDNQVDVNELIDRSRAFAYASDSRLCEEAERLEPLLREGGYG